jgi:hypothetical protein
MKFLRGKEATLPGISGITRSLSQTLCNELLIKVEHESDVLAADNKWMLSGRQATAKREYAFSIVSSLRNSH